MPSTFDTPSSNRTTSSSPAVSLPSERRSVNRNALVRHHRDSQSELVSSPSRQLYEELARVHLDDERRFQDELDLQAKEQSRLHREAIEWSLQKHEEVRQTAEVARQRLELQIQQERQRRAAEEQKALDEDRRKLADQRQREQTRQLDEARQAEEQRRNIAKREQELADQKRVADAQRQKEQDEKRRREEEISRAATAAKAQQQKDVQQSHGQVNGIHAPSPVTTKSGTEGRPNGMVTPSAASLDKPNQTPTVAQTSLVANIPQNGTGSATPHIAGITSTQSEREAVHGQYLDLHQRLKKFRMQFEDMKDNWTKEQRNKFRDWKSAVTTGVAQTSKADSGQSTKAKNKVRDAILEAVKFVPEPQINIGEYIVSYSIPSGAEPKAPVVLLFLLNLFAKCAIKQFCAENLDQERANPIGIQVVQIFAFQDFQLSGSVPLIDILWAKFHIECPLLFGIWGSESTNDGKTRLGWQTDSDRSPYSLESKALIKAGQKLQWVKSQAHHDRIAGIANGFAAITLRNFTRVKMANPAPNRMYWEAMARITNTTSKEVTLSHFTVLKALIDGHVPRFISLYGQAALVALRHALVDFPTKVKPEGVENMPGQWLAVDALPMQLRKELKITL